MDTKYMPNEYPCCRSTRFSCARRLPSPRGSRAFHINSSHIREYHHKKLSKDNTVQVDLFVLVGLGKMVFVASNPESQEQKNHVSRKSEEFPDMVFGFLDEDEMNRESYRSAERRYLDVLDEDGDEETKNQEILEEDKKFWETQHQLLQSNLFKTSSVESRIRNVIKESLKDIEDKGLACDCSKQMDETCKNCLMREVSRRLQNSGFNSAVCNTRWRSSLDIPSGEHRFLDVVESTDKGEIRVIIELNFRAEFEMARGSEDYKQLVQRLPEVYVGKVERLQNVIKILCSAAKKCMKDKKMHIGPWRKQKYMQAKWLGPCERTTSTKSLSLEHSNILLSKPRAKMLTIDSLDKLVGSHSPVAGIV